MKLMILDGNSVINRAFYGVRPLTTRDGLYTNAIFGFLNILAEESRRRKQPDALCVAFDLHGPTFRHLKYDGYKATRHPDAGGACHADADHEAGAGSDEHPNLRVSRAGRPTT